MNKRENWQMWMKTMGDMPAPSVDFTLATDAIEGNSGFAVNAVKRLPNTGLRNEKCGK
jgi:hypothetical protein